MKRYHTAILIAAIILSTATLLPAQYKTESLGAAPADVPKAVQDLLDTKGTRVGNDQGATAIEIWLRKSLPANPSPSNSSDVLYNALSEGGMVGVAHFAEAGKDYRGQAIKAGFYTLRYFLIPQDGNHMGVNPSRDVLVLCPVAADKDLEKNLKFDELVNLSRQASGTPHPGFLVMAPVTGDSFPSAVKDDQGHWNLQLKFHGASGDIPAAVTVVGKWEG